MKTSLTLLTTIATLCLASCETDGTPRNTNNGPGAVAGPTSGWTTGQGGTGPGGGTRDSGSTIRGAGVGAGTSGSTGTGWTYGVSGAGVRR